MNEKHLIEAIVRQTTVLLAQLATSSGGRAPLSHVANQVFLDLVEELEAQGLRKKVVADMFGMALRTYQKKVRRLSESATERGRTLWEAVYEFLRQRELLTRAELLNHFHRDDEAMVRGILGDLVDTGLCFKTGTGHAVAYRLASDEDLGRIGAAGDADGAPTLVWASVYRLGPITAKELVEHLRIEPHRLQRLLRELIAEQRVEVASAAEDEPTYVAPSFLVPIDSHAGWEAAVFDHYQAMVSTICRRLQDGGQSASGGSTWSFDIWPGHPHEEEVRAALARIRTTLGALRERVGAHNDRVGLPPAFERVTTYAGQSAKTVEPELDQGE